MYRKIEQCIGELRVNHTDKDIAGALSEYFQIVKSVSYDYTSIATVADLRADHPELNFMDDAVSGVPSFERVELMGPRERGWRRFRMEDLPGGVIMITKMP